MQLFEFSLNCIYFIEYIHLTTTSNGQIVTLDRKQGKFLWQRDLNSPVVAAFLLGPDGLLSVPFTTVSDEAYEAILEESKIGNVNTVKLLYVEDSIKIEIQID